jgi:hypothetical protein
MLKPPHSTTEDAPERGPVEDRNIGGYQEQDVPRKRQKTQGDAAASTALVLQPLPIDEGLSDEAITLTEDEDLSDIDQEALAQELQALAEEGGPQDLDELGAQFVEGSPLRVRKRKRTQGLGIQEGTDPNVFPDIATDRTTFHDRERQPEIESLSERRTRRSKRTASQQKLTIPLEAGLGANTNSRRSSRSSNKNVRFNDADLKVPATSKEADVLDGSDSSDDDSFVPHDEAVSFEGNKENIKPAMVDSQEALSADSLEISSTPEDSSSSSSESEDDSDVLDKEASSNDALRDEQGGVSLEERRIGLNGLVTNSLSRSSSNSSDDSSYDSSSESSSGDSSEVVSSDSSDSDSDSNSDSEPEGSPRNRVGELSNYVQSHTSINNHLERDEGPEVASSKRQEKNRPNPQNVQEQPSVQNTPPGSGKNKTKNRNQRRKLSRRLHQLKEIGVLPTDASFRDVVEYEGNGVGSSVSQAASLDELESRRKALLATIALGGVDLSSSNSTLESPMAKTQASAPQLAGNLAGTTATLSINDTEMQDGVRADSVVVTDTQEATAPMPIPHGSSKEIARPRTKLNLAGAKRALLGSLGLRVPKNKSEEDDLRTKLSKDVRPVAINPRLEEPFTTGKDKFVDDDQSWKDNVVLKAVECCYESEVLSTPPFPFVQRWDKSQRGPYGGKSGSNKRKRKAQGLVEEEPEKTYSVDSETPLQQTRSMEELHDLSQPPEEDHGEDLPLLPADISSLPSLQLATAVPGAVIAFRYLEMSAATNWQPITTGYRTATIDNISDTSVMELTLALRDRAGGAPIDETTGERLYSKFEMPGVDDGENGYLELAFAAMEDPRLLRAAQDASEQVPTSEPVRKVSSQVEDGQVLSSGATDLTNDFVLHKDLAPPGVSNADSQPDATVRSELHSIHSDQEVKHGRQNGDLSV